VGRGVATGVWSAAQVARAWSASNDAEPVASATFRHTFAPAEPVPADARVTVLIPTIERYPYLRPLLEQLRVQTHRPAEIVIIDQTPAAVRDSRLAQDFADLPIKLLVQEEPGQCRSRNAGLRASTGDFILFIDDDDEVQPTLIADHLAALARHRSDASCGVADEVDAGPLPKEFNLVRTSDTFPTNNAMVRRALLSRTGLFDMAYDRMPRADHDLGMRAYLSGAFMVLDPAIRVLHHHAPRGGLRTHKARVVTYAASREKLTVRHLPSPSEVYLAMRYHSPRRVREMLWQRALGTLSGRGSRWRRQAKRLIGAAQLPDTVRAIQDAEARARAMLRDFPQIEHMA
jgi:glycosyltransferase involved in cell wall biosynthesis